MRRHVQSPQRQMRLMSLKLTGTGTAALDSEGARHATLVDNNTGDYTLTWREAFGRVPHVVASTMTADSVVQISDISTTACTIKAFDATDGTTAKDAVLQIIVLGCDKPGVDLV